MTTDMSKSILNIPKKLLSGGIYIVKLVVKLENVDLTHTDTIFMRIIEDPLQAIITGGILRRLIWKQSFTLDGSHSYYSNQPNEILEFSWHGQVNGNTTAFPMEFYGVKWEIKGKRLLKNVEYIFTLTVSNKVKGTSSTSMQKVILIDEKIPLLVIR